MFQHSDYRCSYKNSHSTGGLRNRKNYTGNYKHRVPLLSVTEPNFWSCILLGCATGAHTDTPEDISSSSKSVFCRTLTLKRSSIRHVGSTFDRNALSLVERIFEFLYQIIQVFTCEVIKYPKNTANDSLSQVSTSHQYGVTYPPNQRWVILWIAILAISSWWFSISIPSIWSTSLSLIISVS